MSRSSQLATLLARRQTYGRSHRRFRRCDARLPGYARDACGARAKSINVVGEKQSRPPALLCVVGCRNDIILFFYGFSAERPRFPLVRSSVSRERDGRSRFPGANVCSDTHAVRRLLHTLNDSFYIDDRPSRSRCTWGGNAGKTILSTFNGLDFVSVAQIPYLRANNPSPSKLTLKKSNYLLRLTKNKSILLRTTL